MRTVIVNDDNVVIPHRAEATKARRSPDASKKYMAREGDVCKAKNIWARERGTFHLSVEAALGCATGKQV